MSVAGPVSCGPGARRMPRRRTAAVLRATSAAECITWGTCKGRGNNRGTWQVNQTSSRMTFLGCSRKSAPQRAQGSSMITFPGRSRPGRNEPGTLKRHCKTASRLHQDLRMRRFSGTSRCHGKPRFSKLGKSQIQRSFYSDVFPISRFCSRSRLNDL